MLVTTNLMAVPLAEYKPQPILINVLSEIKCVEGYQYLYTLVGPNIAVTQMFKIHMRPMGIPVNVPIQCGYK